MLSPDRRIRSYGCGLVAVTDLILTLGEGSPSAECSVFGGIGSMPALGLYNSLLDYVDRNYLHVLPRFGINGIALCITANRLFRRYSLPYRARWGVRRGKLAGCVKEMLGHNIPVIFAVGPHYPFARKKTVGLYRSADSDAMPVSSVSGHYMTILGMTDDNFILTSWGKLYYMRISEFLDYASRYSLPVVSSILYVRKK